MAKKSSTKEPVIAPPTITIPYDTYEKLRADAAKNKLSHGGLARLLKKYDTKGFFTVDFMTITGMSAAFSKQTFVLANNTGSVEMNMSDLKHLLNELPDLAAHAEGVA